MANEISVRQDNGKELRSGQPAGELVSPLADVVETPGAFVLRLDMPGSAKEQISITVENGLLEVRAGVAPLHGDQAKLLFSEIRGGGYYRAFTIGDGVNPEGAGAQYENGVLTVTFSKAEERMPREIRVQ